MRIVLLVTTTYTYDSRVRRIAERLAGEGYDTHVICTYAATGRRGVELAGAVTLHRVAPHSAAILDVIASKLRRSTTQPAPSVPGSAPRRRPSSQRTALRALASPAIAVHRLWVTQRMITAGRWLAPSVVHANDADTLPAAAAIAKRGARLVYDAHELTTGRTDLFRWERWVDARNERRWVPQADVAITVAPGIADILGHEHNREFLVIRNVPVDNRGAPPFDLRARLSIPASARLVLHQGQISPNRGLRNLVRAVGLLPETHLVLLGSSVRGMAVELEALADQIGLDARLHLLAPVPSDQLLSVTTQADVGVVLTEDASLSFRLALPNKLFEYLLAGLPIVSSDLPEVRRVLDETGGGVICDVDDPASIADAIRRAETAADRERVPTAATELQPLLDAYRKLADV